MIYIRSLFFFILATTSLQGGQEIMVKKAETAKIVRGNLDVLFRDNSRSPQILSGIEALFNFKSAPNFDAFDPDQSGASAGLNFEHIIAGHSDPSNKFTPRKGEYSLYEMEKGKSVMLIRNQEDSPWAVSSSFKYTVIAPHYVDFEFKCIPHNKTRFGKRGYAIFFFANYMNDVAEIPIHFLGIDAPDGEEKWIAADGPRTHPDWNNGGTYHHLNAKALEYDEHHNFKLNVWNYDYPKYTKPFYYGLSSNDMVFMLLFDKSYSEADEIRFSIFKFKLPKPRPAWDFQYVIHHVEEGKQYGFKGRLVWKKFISPGDCLQEYERWMTHSGKSY